MQSIKKELDLFSRRHDLGAPPALHHHFSALTGDLAGKKDTVLDEQIELMLNEIEDCELQLKKYEVQMKSRDSDQLYYNQLVQQTEIHIQ